MAMGPKKKEMSAIVEEELSVHSGVMLIDVIDLCWRNHMEEIYHLFCPIMHTLSGFELLPWCTGSEMPFVRAS